MEKNLKVVKEKILRLVVGEDLFLKGFDEKLIGVKKEENKIIEANYQKTIQIKNLQTKKLNLNVKL